jgi:hypothetical protein
MVNGTSVYRPSREQRQNAPNDAPFDFDGSCELRCSFCVRPEAFAMLLVGSVRVETPGSADQWLGPADRGVGERHQRSGPVALPIGSAAPHWQLKALAPRINCPSRLQGGLMGARMASGLL